MVIACTQAKIFTAFCAELYCSREVRYRAYMFFAFDERKAVVRPAKLLGYVDRLISRFIVENDCFEAFERLFGNAP
ncbi:Hypothetical transmembrane protein [Sinorhizobium meliloti 1021]|jgi:hypothetical protein|uniref:Hypothetical transmembrane protein n=1 Tax=Rhizobium meliloti (strain 1021) TaxID=266834 RepID=Q92NY7_RHIME|nr:Hypothetical transmembrane protein [Sinorhizobium meliloti 1021]